MRSFVGWKGYSSKANTYKLTKAMLKNIAKQKYKRLEEISRERIKTGI
jgi:hypothetical protein